MACLQATCAEDVVTRREQRRVDEAAADRAGVLGEVVVLPAVHVVARVAHPSPALLLLESPELLLLEPVAITRKFEGDTRGTITLNKIQL